MNKGDSAAASEQGGCVAGRRGMTHERYMELSRDMSLKLTPEECEAGWHFCYYWDWLLIHDSDDEARSCVCRRGGCVA